MTGVPHGYAGMRVALLTQHGKETVIGPVLNRAFGATVVRVTGFDTDLLGTFTRDVPRAGTPLETARAKARVALTLSELDFALGSEGTFGPTAAGLAEWDDELLVFLDGRRGLEVAVRAGGPARRVYDRVRTARELDALAARAGFPTHGLLVRPDGPDAPPTAKGLVEPKALRAAFSRARRASTTGAVFVESELRAHLNPTRMGVIGRAAEELVARLRRPCPGCGSPGFGPTKRLGGRPCRACRAPTREAAAEQWACPACTYVSVHGLPGLAEPARCDACNP